MTSSRRARAAATSSLPVTASAAPGTRLTSASASYGRSSAFEGMHAQKEHSPPTRRSSTIATFIPCSASLPAATSPAGPAPTTTTSKLRMDGHPTHHYNGSSTKTPGTTGFDVAGSWGQLRVEVPEAS